MHRTLFLVCATMGTACRIDKDAATPCDDMPFRINDCDDGGFSSFADALKGADDGDVISVSGGTWGGTEHRHDGVLDGFVIDTDLTIKGNEGEEVIFEPTDTGAVFFVNSGVVTFHGVIIQNGAGEVSDQDPDSPIGGGVFANAAAELVFEDTIIRNNTAALGGGVWAKNLSLTDSVVEANVATDRGGGIYVDGGTLTHTDATIQSNTAKNGGGLWLEAAVATGTGLALTDNHADPKDGLGGGAVLFGGELHGAGVADNDAGYGAGLVIWGVGSLGDVDVRDNAADNVGGGVYALLDDGTGSVEIVGAAISGNLARLGGGLALQNQSLSMEDSAVASNQSDDGAGIWADQSDLVLSQVVVSDNVATGTGGGALLRESTMAGGSVDDNTALVGGGVVLAGTASLTGASVGGNSADHGGGLAVLTVKSGEADVVGTTLSSNVANKTGGGAYFEQSASLEGVTVSGSTAPDGAGLYLNMGAACEDNNVVLDSESSVVANTAKGDGGGAFVARGSLHMDAGTDWGEGKQDNALDDIEVAGGLNATLGEAAPATLCSSHTVGCVTDDSNDADLDGVDDSVDCDATDPCVGECT